MDKLGSFIEVNNLLRRSKNRLVQDLKLGKKLQITTAKLDFMRNCHRKGLCTPEVAKLAKRVLNTKNAGRIKTEEYIIWEDYCL